jgi:hypothetical protein
MEKTADDNIEITQPSSEQSEKDEDDEVKGGEEHEDDEEDDALSYDPGETPMGCCIFGKYPMTALFGFVFLGLLVGIGLSYWRPETPDEKMDKAMAIQWLGLIGTFLVVYVAVLVVVCVSATTQHVYYLIIF